MYGLVLEGGGAKGSYHAGVYKAILEEQIEISGVAGTSIGALNGAMIVQGDFETVLELWNDISYTDIIQGNEMEIERLLNTKIGLDELKLLSKKLLSVVTDRGFDISPFKELINKNIDEDKIRNSPMDFGIVTINLTDRVPVELFVEDIPYGKVEDYLLASSFVPIFKFEKLDGKIYLDGGFYDNLPFKLLQKKGYEKLILVRTHAKGIVKRPPNDLTEMIIISPSRDIGKSYICDREQSRKNIEMGYFDALKIFRGLKGRLYYIEAKDDRYYLDFLLDLEFTKIKEILEQLNIEEPPSKRVLLEEIVPRLGLIMGLDRAFTYEEFVIELLERKAIELKIEEFKIYSFEELLGLVRERESIHRKPIEDNSLEKIIKKVDLVKYFNKEEAIIGITNIIF